MLRIISGLLLLIISQITFASVSTTTETISATSSTVDKFKYQYSSTVYPSLFTDPNSACVYGASLISSSSATYAVIASGPAYCTCSLTLNGTTYPSEACGRPVTSPTLVYSCPSGYTLSGSNCIKENSIDSCTSYAGQSGYFWVNKVNPPSTICSGTCLASAVTVAGFPDADPLSWQYLQYTYTGETSGCSADSGFTDDASAAAANAAAAERERLAKVAAAIAAAKAACGGEGTYTSGTFNGNTIITCKEKPSQTTVNNIAQSTTTTANPNGSTTTTITTTTVNNTTVNNNNSSTTIGSNGSSSSTSGNTGGSSSSTTKTETITTNPDGSTTTEVTETTSGAGNTAGVFEAPGEGTDYLKDIFSSDAIADLKQTQQATIEEIKAIQADTKNLFNFGSITAVGSMQANTKRIMGADVDLSGQSVIDMFSQGGVGSAFWVLAVLIGITIILTKRSS